MQKGFIGIALLAIGGFIVGSFILAYVGTTLKLFTLPWQKFEAKVDNAGKIIDKTFDANNQIYNYHWFKEREGQIDATRSQIKIAHQAVVDFEAVAGVRSSWTFEDKTEAARLRAVETGLRANLENQVTEYNARANEADRSIFIDGLKTYISLD